MKISSILHTCKDINIKAEINLKNIKNIYYASIVFSIICLMRLFVIFFISPKYIDKIYILLIILTLLISIISCIFVRYIINNNVNRLYNGTYLLYWSILSMIMLSNAVRTDASFNACIHFSVLAILLSLVPILKNKEYYIFVGFEAIITTAIIVKFKLNLEQSCFIFLFICMSLILSHVRYNNFILKLKYRSKLNKALKLSVTDKLTGLLNRRGLESNIESLWSHWVRQKTSVALIMLDIDYFKKYNDTFGHVKGDECIKLISNQISKAIRRKTDFASRVGGEEFLICLSGIDSKDAIMWAKGLKAKIESLELPQAKNNFLPYVTISMGVVCRRPYHDNEFQQMYDEADRSLYEAKEFGRACIVYNKKCFDQRYSSDKKMKRG